MVTSIKPKIYCFFFFKLIFVGFCVFDTRPTNPNSVCGKYLFEISTNKVLEKNLLMKDGRNMNILNSSSVQHIDKGLFFNRSELKKKEEHSEK